MTLWIIEPRDPLIARDGRPFGPDPGARAESLSFPPPSMVVGSLRHKAGLTANGHFDKASIDHIKSLTMRGPLLVELDHDGQFKQFLFPAPADVVAFESEPAPDKSDCASDSKKQSVHLELKRMRPAKLAASTNLSYEHTYSDKTQNTERKIITNLPDGLELVDLADGKKGKPSSRAPQFWYEQSFFQWLLEPDKLTDIADLELGIAGLPRNVRTHVSIAAQTQTAREGALFQTSGLEFVQADHQPSLANIRHFALAAAFEDANGQPYTPPHFTGGLAPLGGERRIARWSRIDRTLPEPPPALVERIKTDRKARVILLSPAHFADGYRPPIEWQRGGVTAKLQAAVVPRAQVISGWDLAKNKPKETRRLAPAGSVYFVCWPDGTNEEDIERWFRATWMRNVSDDEQACRDGFGLAVLGVW